MFSMSLHGNIEGVRRVRRSKYVDFDSPSFVQPVPAFPNWLTRDTASHGSTSFDALPNASKRFQALRRTCLSFQALPCSSKCMEALGISIGHLFLYGHSPW